MKQEAVGTITKSGGFSRVVREVHDTGEPLQIIRNNQVVAMVVPANPEIVALFEQSMNFGKTISAFVKEGLTGQVQRHLLGQVITGIQAQALLFSAEGVNLDMIIEGQERLVQSINEALFKEAVKQRELAEQQSQASENTTRG